MCGRFTLRTPASEIAELFSVEPPEQLPLRFNIAPSQSVLAVRVSSPGERREIVMLRWGLIPSWAKDSKIGNRMINARAETAATKPSFRSALRRRRCLIAADGFFEWKRVGDGKQPFYIRMKDERPFAFAGLWERWEKGAEPIESCTILTTDANADLADLHDRMPVILESEDYPLWMEPDCQDPEVVTPLLRPFIEDALEAVPVSRTVNSPRNDRSECIEPVST